MCLCCFQSSEDVRAGGDGTPLRVRHVHWAALFFRRASDPIQSGLIWSGLIQSGLVRYDPACYDLI